jgi:hypothetical protein
LQELEREPVLFDGPKSLGLEHVELQVYRESMAIAWYTRAVSLTQGRHRNLIDW